VKPGTQNGSKIRLKGFGVPARAGKTNGDLYAVIDIDVPQLLSEEQKVLIEKLRDEGV
jgi:curved DNA-binding protein